MPETRIEENPSAFTLWKNPDYSPVDTITFKGAHIEWGISPDHLLRIRRIEYPKMEYTRADVEKAAEKSKLCIHCNIGHTIESAGSQGFKLEESDPKDQEDISMWKLPSLGNVKINSITEWADKGIGKSLSTAVLPQVYAKVPQMLTSLVGTNLGKKVVDLLIGLGIAGGVYAGKNKLNGRLTDELNVMAGNFISGALDVNPDKGFATYDADIRAIQNGAQFGDAQSVLSAFFKPLPQAFALPNMPAAPAFNLGSFGLPNMDIFKPQGSVQVTEQIPVPIDKGNMPFVGFGNRLS